MMTGMTAAASLPDIPRDYYEIDVTITPRKSTGPFRHWDYPEVGMARYGHRRFDADDSCRVESVDPVSAQLIIPRSSSRDQDEDLNQEDEDDDEEDGGTKVIGPLRIKITVGVKPGVTTLVFSYYLETFGRVKLPAK